MNEAQTKELVKELSWHLVALLVVAVAALLILPSRVREILSLRTEISGQNQEIDQLKQKLADLNSLSEADLFESSTLVLEAFPPEGDLFRNMLMVRKIFRDSGVLLESFKFVGDFSTGSAQTVKEVQPTAGGLSSLKMGVFFSSSFESFKEMVKSMDKILPLTSIENIKFGSIEATESASFSGLSGRMNIVSYFSPLPKTMGRAEQPLPKISNQDKKLIEELRTYIRFQEEPSSGEPVLEVGRENPFPI